jgi:hypothetical protein
MAPRARAQDPLTGDIPSDKWQLPARTDETGDWSRDQSKAEVVPRAHGRNQKVGLLPTWASTEAIAAKPAETHLRNSSDSLPQGVQGSYQQTLDPYSNPTNIFRLNTVGA